MANCLWRKVLLIWILVFVSIFAFGQPVRVFDSSNIGKHVDVFTDINSSLSLDQVVQLQTEGKFKRSSERIVNLGNTNSSFWLHFSYSIAANQELFLLLDVANIDYIDFYTWDDDNRLVQVRTGSLAAPSAGVAIANNYCFKLPKGNGNGRIRQIYLRVRSANVMLIPLKIISAEDLVKYEKTKVGFESIYTGILLMLFLLNIFLFISLGDRTYFYYCIYCAFLLVYVVLYLRGYGYVFGTDIRVMINLYPHFFASMASMAAFLFSWEFLGIKDRVPSLTPLYKTMFLLWILILLISIFGGKSILAVPNNYLSLVSCIIAWYAGWRAYQNGLRPAIYYLIAWGFMGLVFVVALLGISGIIPYHDLSYEVGPIGTSIEMLFLCFALAKRFSYLREEAQRIEKENLRLILSQNERLEMVVSERTEKLSKANEDKNRLFSIVAHDLRSPFNSLRSILELNEHDMLDLQELKMLLSKTRRNVDQIQLTLDNLLFWAKGQMQAPGSYPQLFNLNDLLQKLILVYRPLAESKEIDIEIDFSSSVQVFADVHEINLVLRNLIDNALKFSTSQTVINIAVNTRGDMVEICVCNAANPLAVEKLKELRIKSEFLNTPGKNSDGGIGLGLHLCHQYIRSNCGEMNLDLNDRLVVISFTLPKDNKVYLQRQ